MLFFRFLCIASCLLYSLKGNTQDLQAYSSGTMDSIFKYYTVPETNLFREQYPFDVNYRADYLGTDAKRPNEFSYLWPFSGVLSAQVARYELEKSPLIQETIKNKMLEGLSQYYDERQPAAYASYVRSEGLSDRFYDDNIWLGIDFVDLFLLTRDQFYLDKALEIWVFIESGTDDKLGGGIYWCEQRKESKNTCSNAPGSVLALKLYEATNDDKFLKQGKDLYTWTKHNLQDPTDYVYFDNINLKGKVDETKYSYNSGQMIQAAALLYKLTGEEHYLEDAKKTASGSFNYFLEPYPDTDFPRFKDGNTWFHAIMLRGFLELESIDSQNEYVDVFVKNMDFAWNHMRDDQGFFGTHWSLKKENRRKWLLNQFAMVEMFARLAKVQQN